MLRRILAIALTLGIGTQFVPDARAASGATSLLMGSVATHAGVWNRAGGADTGPQAAGELRARLRLLRVFGFEMAWSPLAGADEGALLQRPRVRMAAQLWVVPLARFGAYLTAGLGARRPGDLFSIAGLSTSYQAGAGAEVYLGDHWAVGAEYLLLVPGVRSIQRHAVERELARQSGARVDSLSTRDVFNARNFQVTVGVRFYFGVPSGGDSRARGSLHADKQGQQGDRIVAQCQSDSECPGHVGR